MSFETLRKTQNAKMDVHSSIISSAYHRPTLVGQAEVGLGRARRPGPVHQIFRGWAATRRSPSHFQKLTARLGPAHHFFRTSLGPARPGLVHHMAARPMRHGLYMGRPDNYVHGLAHGPALVLSRTKRCMCIRRRDFLTLIVGFSLFFPSGFRGTATFCP